MMSAHYWNEDAMKYSAIASVMLMVSPMAAFAQMGDNAAAAKQDSGTVIAPSDAAPTENMVTSSLENPAVMAEDVGLASPGSPLALSDLHSDD